MDEMQQLIQKNNSDFKTWDNAEDNYDKMTTYAHPNGKTYPLLRRHAINGVARRILKANTLANFTQILINGVSGSGKSTLTRRLLRSFEDLAEKGEFGYYTVHWHNGHDMMNIDKIIQDCPVGQNVILIFDDASYTLQDAPKNKVGKLANALTQIRHSVKANVIIFLNIHYFKAQLKFFRNSAFTFMTSSTTEELANAETMFGEKAVKKFMRLYRSQMEFGNFRFQIGGHEDDTSSELIYKTEDFHLGMMNAYGKSSMFIFDSKNPINSDGDPYVTNKKQLVTAQEILDEAHRSYGDYAIHRTLRYYAFFREGNKMMLSAQDRVFWNYLTKLSEKTKIPFSEIVNLIDEKAIHKRKHHVKKKWGKNTEEAINQLVEKRDTQTYYVSKHGEKVSNLIPNKKEKSE